MWHQRSVGAAGWDQRAPFRVRVTDEGEWKHDVTQALRVLGTLTRLRLPHESCGVDLTGWSSLCVCRPVGCPFVSSIFAMEFDGDLLAEYLSSEIEAARLLARKFPEVTPLAHVTSLCALRMALCDPCMLDEVWADVDLFVRC